MSPPPPRSPEDNREYSQTPSVTPSFEHHSFFPETTPSFVSSLPIFFSAFANSEVGTQLFRFRY